MSFRAGTLSGSIPSPAWSVTVKHPRVLGGLLAASATLVVAVVLSLPASGGD